MASLRSPYQVLNLSPDAEPVVIEAAYKALIKKYHPDLWLDDPSAQRRAAAINEAFATLRDPAAKSECDRIIRARRALGSAPLQPVAVRRRGGGLWWGGWAVAVFLGVAQFLPWDQLGVEPAERVGRAPAAAVAANRTTAPPAAAAGVESAELRRHPLAEAEENWLPVMAAPAPVPPPQAEPRAAERLAANDAATASPVKTPQVARQRSAPAKRRSPPPSRRSVGESEFLERQGYIY